MPTRLEEEKYSHDWKVPGRQSIWVEDPDGSEVMEFNDMEPGEVETEVERLRARFDKIIVRPSMSENDLLNRGYLTPEQMSDPADWE